jgi:hypothetical protein
MPNFKPFRKTQKPTPQRRLKAWNVDVGVRLDPLQLAPGSSADHVISIENLNPFEQVEMAVKATCRGPHLRYGTHTTWEPTPALCDASSRVDPAAMTRVTLPLDTNGEALPCVEQIDLRITLVWEDQARPTPLRHISTLRLVP